MAKRPKEEKMPGQIYKIGEAAQVLGLKSYVLRFWESEFPQLNPTRTESGQRLYSEQDLALLRRIRNLLHERGLTIEGARKVLNDLQNADNGLSSELLDEGYHDFFMSQDPDDEPALPRPLRTEQFGAAERPQTAEQTEIPAFIASSVASDHAPNHSLSQFERQLAEQQGAERQRAEDQAELLAANQAKDLAQARSEVLARQLAETVTDTLAELRELRRLLAPSNKPFSQV